MSIKRLRPITDGTSQDGRLAESLRDHYFDVDERTFEQLVARSSNLAKYVSFYNAKNQKEGFWNSLFESDEVLVLADIVASDTARMEKNFLQHESHELELALYLKSFAHHIDRWYQRLRNIDESAARTMCGQLEAVITTRLRDAVGLIVSALDAVPADDPDAAKAEQARIDLRKTLHPTWDVQASAETHASHDRQPHTKADLKIAFYSMVSTIAFLRPIASDLLHQSFASKNHDPAAALFIMFTRLLSAAQQEINQFSSRHRDFYYRDVLKMKPRPQVLDSTFLLLLLNPNVVPLLIPRGTPFTAGKVEGQGEILYETANDVVVTDACVRSVLTLFCPRSAVSSTGQAVPDRSAGYIDGIRRTDILSASASGGGTQAGVSWPLFGGTASGEASSIAEDAEIGFAIASPTLRLSEGERSVSITITFRPPALPAAGSDSFVDQFRRLLFDQRFVKDLQRQVDTLIDAFDKSQLGPFRDQMARSANPVAAMVVDFEKRLLALKGSYIKCGWAIESLIANFCQDLDTFTKDPKSDSSLVNDVAAFRKTSQDFEAKALAIESFIVQAKSLGFESTDLLMQDPGYVFYVVMRSAFLAGITVGKGWYEFPAYGVSIPAAQRAGEYEVTFSMQLGVEAPPVVAHSDIVHGGQFGNDSPVLRFRLNPRAKFYAYSLFEGMAVEEITIESSVSEASAIVAWNQFGRLDTSKPFAPFGPLPTTSSYLVVGNYEAAGMNLTELVMQMEWGDLPDSPGGFAEYYRDYNLDLQNDSFLVRQNVLRDGRWRPLPSERDVTSRLFEGYKEGPIGGTRTMPVPAEVLQYFKPIDPAIAAENFRYDQKARGGFFRLELAAPASAFGHRDYPYLVTAAVAANARKKRFRSRPLALPGTPYTPTINRISFSYKAASLIRAGAAQGVGPNEDRVFHIHPFGAERVGGPRSWPLLPAVDHDGNLFIGFTAADASGTLTLLFHLREDSATTIEPQPEPVVWYYLASNQWLSLRQDSVVSDTTNGFLRSGIVILDLPADIDRNNTTMPASCFWLRASTRRVSPSVCTMYSVNTQAVSVVRTVTPISPSVLPAPLPPGTIHGPMVFIPGLRGVSQPIASIGGRQQEDPGLLITRTAERLRHRERAVTPWDYERLILDAFPDVFKVKCFPNMSASCPDEPAPGHVLIAVVSQKKMHNGDVVFDPMLDANQLKSIQEYVQQRASLNTTIEVRNPNYERIVIRCKVTFGDPARSSPIGVAAQGRGYLLRQLNQDMIDFLSPWSNVGLPPRFGWSLQLEQVEAFVRGLPYVRWAAALSLLKLTQLDDGKTYELLDTAPVPDAEISPDAIGPDAGTGSQTERKTVGSSITPHYPWSLAIPNGANIIDLVDSPQPQDYQAVPTGIGALDIGDIFTVNAFTVNA